MSAGGAAFAHPGDWARKAKLIGGVGKFEPPRMETIGERAVPRLSLDTLGDHLRRSESGYGRGGDHGTARGVREGASRLGTAKSSSSSIFSIVTHREGRDPHPNTMFKESEEMKDAKV